MSPRLSGPDRWRTAIAGPRSFGSVAITQDTEKALRDGLVDDDHHEECSQYVLDMMRSLAELISTYEKARRDQPNLPPVDGWLSAEYP
jgi:hypothetical protein